LTYKIIISDEAKKYLGTLDVKTRTVISRKIESLKESPYTKGNQLSGNLARFRTIHAAGRYRVIYEVKTETIMVMVIAVGIRKEGAKVDVYETMKKLLRLKIL
jgi:mRNA interferase RelE/StbE